MRRVLWILLVALIAAPVFAKSAKWSPPYVVAGPNGVFYAKSVAEDPSQEGSTKGTTKVYRVGKDADELLDSYDWYAPRHFQPGVAMAWSPIAGKVAVMRTHDEPIAMADERVELSFYLGGKFLKAYTVKDLVGLGAKTQDRAMPKEESRATLDYKVMPSEQVPNTNNYRFVIEVAGDRKVQFDVLTGEVVVDRAAK